MNKKIYLRDYENNKISKTLKDFENIIDINVKILSGDEVLKVTYNDGVEIILDSSQDREINYLDDSYNLPLDKIDEFSNFNGSAYECADAFKSFEEYEFN